MTVTLNRLTSSKIKKIITQGKRKNNQFLVFYWQDLKKPQKMRVIIISKEVDKRAVVRNRLRRVISEQLRVYDSNLESLSLVVKVKKTAVNLDSRQLRKETVNLLSICRLIKISA